MFKTFINKAEWHFIDLSTILAYYPEQVLFYYYNSYLKISLAVYHELNQMAKKERQLEAPLFAWLELFDEQLEITADISALAESKFLHTIGPYYYPGTNSRFYFTKSSLPSEIITAADISLLIELGTALPISRDILSYSKNRRDSKKQRSIEELIKDISMCMSALTEIEKLEKHISYLEKCLKQRYQIVEQEDFYPQEPDNQPEKPEKMIFPPSDNNNLVDFILPGTWRKKYTETFGHFSHDTKVYLIRYREFEKSLERFKKVLADWNNHKWNLTDKCFEDIAAFEAKLKTAKAGLVIYRNILNKSYVHTDYQNFDSLILFKYYLETGRACEIQECMNLYEEERHWAEIKESQIRIENTIHLLRKEGVDTGQLSEQVNNLLNTDYHKHNAVKS
ncbi:MAG TPA: hypothetical protein PKN87_03165 [Syntrophomonadaceae bacterium]|nr:hypothetical protein [Syntrophomonadaceae bacterium]HNX28396.1 hypothetical protein [Syntrophomonadaceae bacterium]HPR92672.1 hypothetical protein [Syntrophomonadaceae bacterium]